MAAIKAKRLDSLLRLLGSQTQLQPMPYLSVFDPHVKCWVLREDLRHPVVSGNKWHKLYYHLIQALHKGVMEVASAGGAYSNHLHALAWVGRYLGIQTHGIVRGERPDPMTPTLIDVEKWGMKLHFISRTQYRNLRNDPTLFSTWANQAYWIPEGANDALGLLGAMRFGRQIRAHSLAFDYLLLACGTATTVSGLALSHSADTEVIGIPVFKGSGYLKADVKRNLSASAAWAIAGCRLITDFHFGGFACTSPLLVRFENSLHPYLPFDLDPVYTLKAFYALCDLLSDGFFRANSRVLFIHTGGLQGRRQAHVRDQ